MLARLSTGQLRQGDIIRVRVLCFGCWLLEECVCCLLLLHLNHTIWDCLDALECVLLLVLQALVYLLKDLVLDLPRQAVLLCSLRDGAGWQVKVNLVYDLAEVTFHVSHYNRLGELLPIRLIATVMLDLDVKVE